MCIPRPLLLLIACLGSVLEAHAENKRPNIVFLFSDDHAYQAISAYNDARKLIETPNIDRIAKEGMRFDRCLVPNSICGPSRACVLTGKYNHLNGFPNNSNSKFDNTQVTFPKLLQAAGYQTAIIGKWHLESDPTGFNFSQILIGQGLYYNPPMIINGERKPQTGYVTDLITGASLDWLKKCDKSKPFLLMCQQKAPHREWEPAIRDLDHDKGRVYEEPSTLFDNYEGRGLAEKTQDMTLRETMNAKDNKLTPPPQLSGEDLAKWNAYYEPRNAKFRDANLQGDDLVHWKYQRYMHDYLGCIRAVDDSVGQILKYLDDEKLADNTIVIYSSDQGFYLGEHGWFDKRWIYEESMRTPFLVKWPGVTKPGSVSKDIVSTIDFAETFLDAAGLPSPAEMQGRSLRPVLAGATPADWRKSFYYQYFEFPVPHHVRPHYGVVTDRYKLFRFFGTDVDYWEMFDLQKDPHELTSIYGQPEYAKTQADLEKELARLRKELKVPETIDPKWFGNKPVNGPAAEKK